MSVLYFIVSLISFGVYSSSYRIGGGRSICRGGVVVPVRFVARKDLVEGRDLIMVLPQYSGSVVLWKIFVVEVGGRVSEIVSKEKISRCKIIIGTEC